jgi:hypothetical protein
MLSTTGPLLQAWYTRASGGAIPYRLFALSNFGSFLALLSFPFVFEPTLTSAQQTTIWSVAFGVFAACAAYAGWSMVKAIPTAQLDAKSEAADEVVVPISAGRLVLWVALAACASIMLIAVSSHLTLNVAPMPFLWVLPLSIYLLTFILSFESDRVYSRGTFIPLLVATLGVAAYMLTEENRDGFGPIYLWSAILFVCCMVCHGELALQKPHPKQLTLFFLMVSVGGAIGGTFVAMIAPVWFHNYYELAVSLGLCGLLAAAIVWKETPETWRQSQGWAVVGITLIMISQLWYHTRTYADDYASYKWYAMIMAFSFVVAVGLTWLDFMKRPEAGLAVARARERSSFICSAKAGCGLARILHSDRSLRAIGISIVLAARRGGTHSRGSGPNRGRLPRPVPGRSPRLLSVLQQHRLQTARAQFLRWSQGPR